VYGGWEWPNIPTDTWTFANPLSLSVATPASGGGDVGQQQGLAIAETGAALPISYAWSGLPPGCTPSRLPTVECLYLASGTTNVTVSALDSANVTASVTFPLTIAPPLSATLLVSGNRTELGAEFVLHANASGGTNVIRFNWGEVTASLGCNPPADGGLLNCTPTYAGNLSLNVSVTDANFNTVSSPSLQVQVEPALSVVGFSASNAITHVGQVLRLTVSASGGVTPDSFRYAGLPPGCGTANSSVLSCTPTAAGTYPVSANVTDAAGASVVREINVTVDWGAVGLFGLSLAETYGLIGGLVAVGLAGVVFWIRRSRLSGG
jgi:hypothetical protein